MSVLSDITENVEIATSSRPAMVPNLMDQTTETFWESSEDDKNKFKTITIHCTRPSDNPKAVYVHFDNCRDLNVSVNDNSALSCYTIGSLCLEGSNAFFPNTKHSDSRAMFSPKNLIEKNR